MKPETEHSKEILHWAREKYASAPESEKANWEYMFPKLKESEDEKIRKYIVKFVELEKGVNLPPEEADKMLAYLEKKKEPLPVPDKFSGLKSLMLQYLQSAANRKDDAEIENDTDLFGRKILDYVWKHDEKQKEQKPAEMPKGEDYGIDGLYAAVDILQTTLGKVKGYQTDDGILEHKCAISAVKELYEQQLAEWSEEDEKNLNLAINIVASDLGEDSPTVSLLKSIKNRIQS